MGTTCPSSSSTHITLMKSWPWRITFRPFSAVASSAVPAYEPKSTLFELAATLCVGLTKNRPFIDGNKRTALLETGAFLFLNGYALEPTEEDEVLTMVAVADGSVNEQQLADWLRKYSARRT